MPIELSKDELHRLQQIDLEMMLEVDRICRKHNIQYSLDGGTLLGAVRHKGFIPWDDDADIIFLRREYTRFKRACKTDLDTNRFFLQDYTTDPYYRWGYAKLRRNGTSFVRSGQEMEQYRDGIYIDVFVVDHVPDNRIHRSIHHLLCFFIRKGMYSEVGKKNASCMLERVIYQLMSLIPRDFWFRRRNQLARLAGKRRTELVSHYTFEYPERCRYGMPRECFDEMIDMEFEGYVLRGFKKYDLYLRTLFGDYMKLPPVEQRVSHLKLSSISFGTVEGADKR